MNNIQWKALKRGDRVQMNDGGKKTSPLAVKRGKTTGTVTGITSRTGSKGHIYVLQDGNKRSQPWHYTFWDPS